MSTENDIADMDGSILNNYPYAEAEFERWIAGEELDKMPVNLSRIYRSILIRGWNAAVLRVPAKK